MGHLKYFLSLCSVQNLTRKLGQPSVLLRGTWLSAVATTWLLTMLYETQEMVQEEQILRCWWGLLGYIICRKHGTLQDSCSSFSSMCAILGNRDKEWKLMRIHYHTYGWVEMATVKSWYVFMTICGGLLSVKNGGIKWIGWSTVILYFSYATIKKTTTWNQVEWFLLELMEKTLDCVFCIGQ